MALIMWRPKILNPKLHNQFYLAAGIKLHPSRNKDLPVSQQPYVDKLFPIRVLSDRHLHLAAEEYCNEILEGTFHKVISDFQRNRRQTHLYLGSIQRIRFKGLSRLYHRQHIY